MAHCHHHHHHHPEISFENLNRVFIVSVILNAGFVVLEAAAGFWCNSVGLLSDAGHNLGDVLSLLLSMAAFRLSRRKVSEVYTYGYKKATVLASFLNALLLVAVSLVVMAESVSKFTSPGNVEGDVVAWVAAAGVVVNGLTAFLLMRSMGNDINVKGAFFHMAADALVSVGVLVSGVLVSMTGLMLIDAVVGFCISVIILLPSLRLLRQSLRLLLDAVPETVDRSQVERLIRETVHVRDCHHLHIWAMSTTETALTAHVVVDAYAYADEVKADLCRKLREEGIHHLTFEVETDGAECARRVCG